MMDGIAIPEPSKTLGVILGSVVYIRALAFGDILPE